MTIYIIVVDIRYYLAFYDLINYYSTMDVQTYTISLDLFDEVEKYI